MDEGKGFVDTLFSFSSSFTVRYFRIVVSRISTSCAAGMRETRVRPCLRIKSRACDPPSSLLPFRKRREKHFCPQDSRSSHLVSLAYPVTLRKSLLSTDFFPFFFFFLPFLNWIVECEIVNQWLIRIIEEERNERLFWKEIGREFSLVETGGNRWRLLYALETYVMGSRTTSIDTIKFRPERLSYTSIQTQPLVARWLLYVSGPNEISM